MAIVNLLRMFQLHDDSVAAHKITGIELKFDVL